MKLLFKPRRALIFPPALGRLLAILTLLLCGSVAAFAHGPGLEEVNRITSLMNTDGEQPQLYVKRALVYQANQHWQEAMSDFNKAAELDSLNAQYDVDRARLSYQAGEFQIALDFIDLFLLRGEMTTEAWLIKARSFRALQQIEKAIPAYAAAMQKWSTMDSGISPEWYVEYSNTLQLLGENAEALDVFEQGINRLGSLSVFQTGAIRLEVDLARYDSALKRNQQLLDQAQRKDIWLSQRADILSKAGRLEEARLVYQQAYAELQRLPQRLQNLPVSRALAETLKSQI